MDAVHVRIRGFFQQVGGNVTSYLLKFLMDLNRLDDYAWGVAILINLYRELEKATRATCCQMACCMPLLLCWIYEHFPQLRRPAFDSTYSEEFLRLRRWMLTTNSGNHKDILFIFQHLMDELDPY